jgi:poly-gamma-glutamate synthase PgsB/CapB
MLDLAVASTLLLSRDVAPDARLIVLSAICLLACTFLWARAAAHRHRLARIRVRVQVAGTRGKSTAVRLIAAGFRGGGFRVVAKVTGTEPRLILPDGTEQPIRRWGAPAIREQQSFLAAAHRARAEVIVSEAMAIQPEYLRALERFYIRATDLVVTNVRPDHQEQLGVAADAISHAIAECVPFGGRVYVSAEAAVPAILDRAAAQNNAILVEADVTPSGDPEQANRNLALAVCRRHGISDQHAEEAIRQATQDVGSFRLLQVAVDGGHIEFANAFSCNDTSSLERLWRCHHPPETKPAFLLNPRPDRPIRTAEFIATLARLASDAPLFIASRNPLLRRAAIARGFAAQHVNLVPPRMTREVFSRITGTLAPGTVLWGIGNYKGAGAQITALLDALSARCSP